MPTYEVLETAGAEMFPSTSMKNLTVDPFIAYRAFVDRAHDACVSRMAHASNFSAAILVTTQTIGGVNHVAICDNGEALALAEVRALYDNTTASSRALLAALAIADQVIIATRSHVVRPEAGIRLTCTSSGCTATSYRMARPGTNIQLRIRPEYQALASVTAVRDALLEHARKLSLPIQINV